MNAINNTKSVTKNSTTEYKINSRYQTDNAVQKNAYIMCHYSWGEQIHNERHGISWGTQWVLDNNVLV